MLQQFNQPGTLVQDDIILLQKTRIILSTSKRVPSQQVTRSEYSKPTPFSFHVIKKRQRREYNTDAVGFAENLLNISKKCLVLEKNCTDIYLIPLNREQ